MLLFFIPTYFLILVNMQNIKYHILTLLLFISVGLVKAQDSAPPEETVARTNRDRVNITEKFNVLKSDKKTKQGLYQAYYDGMYSKTTLAASGMYDHGKRIGVWHYYTRQGTLIQHYDFTHHKLLYTIADTVTKYTYDAQLKETDSLSRPIRIGSGYADYCMIMCNYPQVSEGMHKHGGGLYNLNHILNIDADGKLTAYRIVLTTDDGFKQTYNIALETLPEDELLFVPATLNHKPIPSTITIRSTSQTGFAISR
jgi:hypothetical protein